jgi:hypothetical protein
VTDEEPTEQQSFGSTLLEQMFELWIEPELARRGLNLGRDEIRKVVVELDPTASGPIVTINDDAAVVARVRATRAIAAGEDVTEDDFDQVDSVRPGGIGENSGWICFAVIKGQQVVAFDFRYNRARAAVLVERAREFLNSARRDADAAPAVACDTAFSAAELAVQAQMLLLQQSTKRHWDRQRWIETWTDNKNAPASHAIALRDLHSYRAAGRYADEDLVLPDGRLDELLDVAEEMIDQAEAAAGRPDDWPRGELPESST